MGFLEMALHARKKLRQRIDDRGFKRHGVSLENSTIFPALPDVGAAPAIVRETLASDRDRIMECDWKAFGHLRLRVDDPPRWHKDYLARKDLSTGESAFRLNHRELPEGADVKLIWELSRWYEITRLAMAAYVLGDPQAREKCVTWLEDWVQQNAPYRGWNWTSALEAGMRLIQFTWIDALLSQTGFGASTKLQERIAALRNDILPPHVWFTWRHRSFGSSANNHLLGELVGVLLATIRWPELEQLSTNVDRLQLLWEREVMRQFAPDGGNKEQALNYHLFSFELCWHAQEAIRTTGRKVSSAVEERLFKAAEFFWSVQVASEPWDYGDSDSAYVSPFFASESTMVSEWRRWLVGKESPALAFWLGTIPKTSPKIGFGLPAHAHEVGPWCCYQDSGISVLESGFWLLRWDLSPLGHLRTAAHGHLDALHISVWYKGVAFLIDPGTGAYYGHKALRNWLASRSAHNAPCPDGPEWPPRAGPFLWSEHHQQPILEGGEDEQIGILNLKDAQLRRRFTRNSSQLTGWSVEDSCVTKNGSAGAFSVRWQLAPGTCVKQVAPRRFMLKRREESIGMEISEDWAEVIVVETPQDHARAGSSLPNALEREFAGTVSSNFRKTEWAPYLKLVARPESGRACVFRTTFVASPTS